MLVMFPCADAAPGNVTGNVQTDAGGHRAEGPVGSAGENAEANSGADSGTDSGADASGIGNGRSETTAAGVTGGITAGVSGGHPGAQEACQAALDSAIDAFDSLATVNFSRRRNGQPEIRFGLGLDLGKVIYGNVGAPDRLAFTVIGPTVNRTARLESLTKATGQPVLMSDSFAQNVAQAVTFVGHFEMKGIPEPQPVYALKNAL
ncbi:adenylate/guanylate cyclase domain-containing protein [Denitrobaculum tricleocarpae]|uniref:Adenylate/guanylate cyclase domain-containing protein n=2 Tax=Denitrobaculum tricleocarpae TaxID=2591009 RepID=A0A545U3C6_9PROT|nr:adenylate/guanylate cyclase domain-containing protein [Denitrobaculum tricleocarpae]